jgi:ribose transport system permease protein
MYNLLRTDWLGLVLLIIVVAGGFGVIEPGFLTGGNFSVMLVEFALTVTFSLGQLTTLSIGQMNLAIGAIGGLAAVGFGGAMQVWGWAPLPAALLGLGIGLGAGVLNGVLIAESQLNSFVVTLATLSLFKGITLGVTAAQPFSDIPKQVLWLGSAMIGVFPLILGISLAVAVAMAILFRHAILGRELLAYGDNPVAATLAGISSRRVIVAAHVLSGLLAALAGLLSVARFQTANPIIGDDWLIASFAIPVIGGASLSGGSVSIVGLGLAVVLVTVIDQGLVAALVNPYVVQLLLGLLILAVVVLNQLRNRRLGIRSRLA